MSDAILLPAPVLYPERKAPREKPLDKLMVAVGSWAVGHGAAWRTRRLDAIARGASRIRVGHHDLLAI